MVIHQNFPGQFAHLVPAWARRTGWEVRAIARSAAPGLPDFAGLTRYELARTIRNDQHPYLRQMEGATLHGQAVARVLLQMKQRGYRPDVILAHPGWGETLYAKDVFPEVRLIHYCEWYYQAEGADLGFDPEHPVSFDDRARIRTWNALHALNLAHCDAAVSPTEWQRSRHPTSLQPKISVAHEGIPIHRLGPDPQAQFTLPNGHVIRSGDPVVTYVARNLEPYRGFHVFMRALAELQARHPKVHAVIVGGDEVSYGRKAPAGQTWRSHLLGEVRIDRERTHFLGRVTYPTYIQILQCSAAHVYLTYPFVLSWSLLEALACGAVVVASKTAPVQEVITDGVNGVLVDFFAHKPLAHRLIEILGGPEQFVRHRLEAQASTRKYDWRRGLAAFDRLITPDTAKASAPNLNQSHLPSGSSRNSELPCTQPST